jgi:DNA-binding transcriptional MerR regulator
MEPSHDIEQDKKLESEIDQECLESDLEMEFNKKSENLKKIMDRLQNRIKHAVISNDADDNNPEKSNIDEQVNYLKEINEKLDKLPKIVSDADNSKIEDTLNQILEKINVLIDKNNEYSSKLDNIILEIDKVLTKIEDMSEKALKLYESGNITILDIINLIKEINLGINDIKDILNNYKDENIDKAIEIADNLNNKMDTHIEEFEKIKASIGS